MKPVIGFAGMTHLGICSAVAAAGKAFRTIAFDVNTATIEQIDVGRLPVIEPGLADLLQSSRAHITFSADAAMLADCDLVYIAPDVPTDDHGESDTTSVDSLLELVLGQTGVRTVVVILSQVSPGFTRARQRPGRCILYQVETLAFGMAVERATRPERFMVGLSTPDEPLPGPLASYLGAYGCPILPMRFESAELAKISINCCLVASISVANTLAQICENIGADWSEIAPALKLDRRIGAYAYLAPGLGLAGGNLERDLATVLRLSQGHGTEASLIHAFVTNSRHRKGWALRTLCAELLSQQPNPSVAVLGLAYKENTHSIKNSPSLALLAPLGPWPVRAFDPAIRELPTALSHVTLADSALEAVDGADALAIMTPWPEFRRLDWHEVSARMRGRLAIDPYRVIAPAEAKAAGLRHVTLGVTNVENKSAC